MKTLWESFCEQYQSRSSFTRDGLEEARRKAEAYIKANPKKDLYPVEYDRPEDDMELCFLLPMSEEELALVKRLKEWNEEEENEEKNGTKFKQIRKDQEFKTDSNGNDYKNRYRKNTF